MRIRRARVALQADLTEPRNDPSLRKLVGALNRLEEQKQRRRLRDDARGFNLHPRGRAKMRAKDRAFASAIASVQDLLHRLSVEGRLETIAAKLARFDRYERRALSRRRRAIGDFEALAVEGTGA